MIASTREHATYFVLTTMSPITGLSRVAKNKRTQRTLASTEYHPENNRLCHSAIELRHMGD